MKNYMLALGLVVGLGMGSANAAGLTHEISAAAGLYRLGLASGTTAHALALNGNYFYSVDRNIQVGLHNELAWTSVAGVSALTWQPIAMVGLTMMGSDIRDDVFVRAGAGMNLAASTALFVMRFELGKRFALTDSVAFTPYVSSTTILTSQTTIDVVPLSFALFL